jgi:hypothetical protein
MLVKLLGDARAATGVPTVTRAVTTPLVPLMVLWLVFLLKVKAT